MYRGLLLLEQTCLGDGAISYNKESTSVYKTVWLRLVEKTGFGLFVYFLFRQAIRNKHNITKQKKERHNKDSFLVKIIRNPWGR